MSRTNPFRYMLIIALSGTVAINYSEATSIFIDEEHQNPTTFCKQIIIHQITAGNILWLSQNMSATETTTNGCDAAIQELQRHYIFPPVGNHEADLNDK